MKWIHCFAVVALLADHGQPSVRAAHAAVALGLVCGLCGLVRDARAGGGAGGVHRHAGVCAARVRGAAVD